MGRPVWYDVIPMSPEGETSMSVTKSIHYYPQRTTNYPGLGQCGQCNAFWRCHPATFYGRDCSRDYVYSSGGAWQGGLTPPPEESLVTGRPPSRNSRNRRGVQ